MRPKTGLKDMYLALDPGTKQAGALPEGGHVTVQNTLPDVNADEVLAQLDTDTRAYLEILLSAGGTAFDDHATGADKRFQQTAEQDLREVFKRFEPTARYGDADHQPADLAPPQHHARDPQLPAALDRPGQARRPARRLRGLRQQELRGLRLRGVVPARRAARVPQRAVPDDHHVGEDRQAGRAARAGALAAAAVCPQAGAGAAQDATVPEETTPIIQKQIRPFARDVQPLCATSARRPRSSHRPRRG